LSTFLVFQTDNFHPMDPEHEFQAGQFATFEEARAAVQRIVDESLQEVFKAGMTAEKLLDTYDAFGEGAYIVELGEKTEPRFSSREYAEARCAVLCARSASEGSDG
jgi:hypothetical protein